MPAAHGCACIAIARVLRTGTASRYAPRPAGTHWSPGDPPPAQFKLAQRDIEDRYTTAAGQGAAEALELARKARLAAEAAAAEGTAVAKTPAVAEAEEVPAQQPAEQPRRRKAA